MGNALSPRLAAIIDALPLIPGMRVLEIGCGPGAMARAIAERIGEGFVLGIDRSDKATGQAMAASTALIAAGRLGFRTVAVEEFMLAESELPFDLAVAIRVGALDGRHPEAGVLARKQIRAALKPGGLLLIDGGMPLRPVSLTL